MAYNLSPLPDAVEFSELVMEDRWDDVIKCYHADSKFHKIIIKTRGTALHMAVSRGLQSVVRSLVEAIENFDDKSCLSIIHGDATPLHLAAYAGFTTMCEILIGKNDERKYLIQLKNANGETPLFWAVIANKILVFLYLQQFYPLDLSIAINNNNTSILHVAIQGEMFDLACVILYCYKGIGSIKDQNDLTPLQILATMTSAFESGIMLSWWQRILYHCFTINVHDAKTTVEMYEKKVISKENVKKEKGDYNEVAIPLFDDDDDDELENSYEIRHSLSHPCIRIQEFVFKWSFTSLAKTIKTIKKKHIYGGLLLGELMKTPYSSYMCSGDPPNCFEFINCAQEEGNTLIQEIKSYKKIVVVEKSGTSKIIEVESDLNDTAFLIATRYGIVEIMSTLESRIRSVIHETNNNNENALLLAVKHRRPQVVQWLQKILPIAHFKNLTLRVDKDQNTMLHLAASYTSSERKNTWKISGPALQLTWEIKWYEYIKRLVPEHFNNKSNKEGKFPIEVFEDRHEELLQKSVDWLKNTTESYSVVAALIASVAFATSGSVPGGNQPSGEPALKGQPAFEVFAISSLIGLYFSITALIMFLSIITSGKEFNEFRLNLPLKLLFGLTSLFVSIVAMFVSFCAGHFFVLTDKYSKGGILFYLYISICLPVTIYAAVQFHLIVDIVKVIWNKVPPARVDGVIL